MMPRFVLTTVLLAPRGRLARLRLFLFSGISKCVGKFGDGTHYTSELSFCVEEVNRLRASAGKSSLVRSDALEKYAATAVQADALAGKAHTYAALDELRQPDRPCRKRGACSGLCRV